MRIFTVPSSGRGGSVSCIRVYGAGAAFSDLGYAPGPAETPEAGRTQQTSFCAPGRFSGSGFGGGTGLPADHQAAVRGAEGAGDADEPPLFRYDRLLYGVGAPDQNSDRIHAAEPAESGFGVRKEDPGGSDAD